MSKHYLTESNVLSHEKTAYLMIILRNIFGKTSNLIINNDSRICVAFHPQAKITYSFLFLEQYLCNTNWTIWNLSLHDFRSEYTNIQRNTFFLWIKKIRIFNWVLKSKYFIVHLILFFTVNLGEKVSCQEEKDINKQGNNGSTAASLISMLSEGFFVKIKVIQVQNVWK